MTKSIPRMAADTRSRESSPYFNTHTGKKKTSNIEDYLERVEKNAIDPRKGSINLKSLEENETENYLLQEPEENFKKCIVFKIPLEM